MAQHTESPAAASNARALGMRLLRMHALTMLVGIVAILFSIWTRLPMAVLMDPLSSKNIVRIILFGTYFVLLVFGHIPRYQLFRAATSVVVPLVVVLLLMLIWHDPLRADDLARESLIVEDLSVAFLLFACLCLGTAGLLFARRRQWLTAAVSALGTAAFFLVGMEEVSWFQHELNYQSGTFFREHNDQGETNFHNIYTNETEDVYYTSRFLLLVILPYFSRSIGAALTALGQGAMAVLVPPTWLIAPFVLAGGFVAQQFASRATSVAIVIGSFVVLVGLLHRYAGNRSWSHPVQIAISLILLLGTIVLLMSLDLAGQGARPWIGKEYQEFFIAWGCAAYGASVMFRLLRRPNAASALPQSATAIA